MGIKPSECVTPLQRAFLMWTTGDGPWQRLCITDDDVRNFLQESIFGEPEPDSCQEMREIDAHFANFKDSDNWSQRIWNLNFEDGGVHAMRIDFPLDTTEAAKELLSVRSEMASSGWIPVGERLPEKGQRVLVCSDAVAPTISEFNTWTEQPAGPAVGGHVTHGPWFIDTMDDPTHWMPLPGAAPSTLSAGVASEAPLAWLVFCDDKHPEGFDYMVYPDEHDAKVYACEIDKDDDAVIPLYRASAFVPVSAREEARGDTPRRAVILDLSLQADSREALIQALANIERRIAMGELTRGCSGGYDSGYTYHYEENAGPTHDEYGQQLKDWLAKRSVGPTATGGEHG